MKHGRWSQVEEFFHAALERAPEERQAFLVRACGEDTELRLQVEHLISIDQRAGSCLERPVTEEVFATLDADAPLEGAQVGPYRILSPLGAGGMGKVYRARDTKLGRDVAIKTLPSEFARNPERLARLRREARTLASLNHPNIASIYGLEEFGDSDWLVLELVEGQNLRGPLPIERALDYARQVAAALQAAHEKGIIHRDLKPANVKVTPQGSVKVLDFGLAKAIWGTESNPDLSEKTPLIGVETTAGLFGTPGYMSPEQAGGGKVDQRTDIWAFGCLFYELLTGSRAFPGDTVAETIAAVMDREPDWRALPVKTPAKIRELLRQCLQKDVNRRLPDIVAAGRIIAEAQAGWNRWQAAGIGVVALALLAAGAVFWPRGPASPPDRSDWVQLTRFPDPVSQPALSRDGGMLAFVRGPRTTYGLGQVYVKQLPDGEPIQLTHDDLKKADPTFSPDGARVAYTLVDAQFNWDTWVVPVSGGEEPRPWLKNASALSWTGPRQLLFTETKIPYPRGIVAARDDRTSSRDVYLPRNARGMADRSQASPDGKWVLVAEMSPYGNWDQCRLVPMDGRSQGRQIGPPRAPCSFGTWSPDGKWMYLTSKAGGLNHIWRQRFPDGEPELFTPGLTEEEGIAMSADGRSLITAVALENSTLWIHDARGERQISVLEGNAAYPKFAPDGKHLYYRVVKAVPILGTKRDPGEIWVADLESGHSERVAPGFEPLNYDISRNGQQVAMEVLDGEGKPRLWLAPVDRSSSPRQIPNVEGQNPLFGPDGDIFFRHGPSSFVYRIRPDGTALRKALEQPAFYATNISPDGRWIQLWGPLPGYQSAVVQLVPLDGGRAVVIGSNTFVQWSSSGDSLWISAGAVPDGRTYIVPMPKGNALPPFPEGGFHSEKEVAALPGARRLDAEGAPGPSIDSYTFERHTIQRNLYRIPIP